MKKFILLLCFLAMAAPKGYSQLFVENFDYASGTLLTTTGVWSIANATVTNPLTVVSPGLTYPNYAGSGIGNAVGLTTTGEDDSARVLPLQTTGTLYASFMLNLSAAQATGDYFFCLTTTGAPGTNCARVYARSSGAGYNLGLTKTTEATITWGSAVYNFGTTYLVIDKYAFVGGALNDEASLFVFDPSTQPPMTEPSPTIGPVTSASTDAANLAKVILRQGTAGSAPTLVLDGIYVDNVWNNTTLPVELASFTSSVSGRNVELNWSTVSELNNNGFDVERAVNGVWSKVGFVAGNGTTNDLHNYSFTDRNLASSSYSYRLKQVDFNGNFEYHNLSNEVIVGVPSKFELSQNYPNPFNPSTTINYDVPFDSKVSLTIFDMSGKEISMIVNETKTAGYYSVSFNAASLSSGIYFYTLSAGDFVSTKKMILVK